MREGLKMYDIVVQKPNYVFEDYITIDGRYLILNDYVFDLKEQREMGSVFSIDNLKTIFENLNVKNSPLLNKMREILNDGKISINEIRTGIINQKELLVEQEYTDEEPSITSTETQQSALGKGVLWFARKVKKVLWSVGGIMADAFLVASGIGKTVQWIPWAIILALDIYQWASGDYGTDTEFEEASPLWKGLTIGFEVMGLMTTGVVAKGAMKVLSPLKVAKNESEMAKIVAKNPKMKNILTKIYDFLGGVPNRLKTAEKNLEKMPKLARWIGKVALSIPKTLGWIGGMIGRILKGAGSVVGKPGKLAQKAGEAIQGSKGLQSTKYFTKVDPVTGKLVRNIGSGLKGSTNTGMALGTLTLSPSAIRFFKGNGNSAGLSPIQQANFKKISSELDRQLSAAF